MNITITTEDSFGKEKQIGLDEYVESWTWGVKSIPWLGDNLDEIEELEGIKQRIKDLAVRQFFKLYEEEQRKKEV